MRDSPLKAPTQALLNVLGDRRWHGGLALRAIGGHNYTARLQELRDLGYPVRTSRKRGPDGFASYRLSTGVVAPVTVQKIRVEFTWEELHALVELRKSLPSMREKLLVAFEKAKARRASQGASQGGDEVLDELLGDA